MSSLWLIYYSLQVCALKQQLSYSPKEVLGPRLLPAFHLKPLECCSHPYGPFIISSSVREAEDKRG